MRGEGIEIIKKTVERQYDLIVYGATGFTGQFVADYRRADVCL